MYRGRFIPREPAAAAANPSWQSSLGQSRSLATRITQTDRKDPGLRRIACILVADFSLAALTRANPDLRDRALALIRLPAPRPDGKNRAGQRRTDYQPHSELSEVAAV